MPAAETLLLFAAATLAVGLTPGPGMIYLTSRSLGQGTAAGVVSALGLGAGSMLHAAAVALGLSAILVHVPAAFVAIKVLGAGYLVWLGIGMLRRPGQHLAGAAGVAPRRHRRVFAEAVATQIMNPNIALFFLAFIPQFVSPDAGAAGWQLVFFGALFHVIDVPVNLAIAIGAGTLGAWLAGQSWAARLQQRITGAALVALGLRLAYQARP